MRKGLGILLVVASVGCQLRQDAPPDIAGMWEQQSLSMHGVPWSHPEGLRFVTIFTNSTFRQTLEGKADPGAGTYVTRRASPLAELDMIYNKDSRNVGATVECLYQRDGDTLTIWNQDGGPRPTSLTGTNLIVQIMKRVK